MDGELVSGSLSVNEGGEHQKARSPFLTYTEHFYEQFPYYLSIGMSAEQYWDGDPWLVKYYRKAEEIRMERKNQELWLQGLYVYEAICDVSPVLHSFAKRGTKPIPYTNKPYAITEKKREEEKEEKEKATFNKGKLLMEALMKKTNEKFKKDDGR